MVKVLVKPLTFTTVDYSGRGGIPYTLDLRPFCITSNNLWPRGGGAGSKVKKSKASES